MKTFDVPMDTIFEREVIEPPMDPKAVKLFKMIILGFADSSNLGEGMTPTELINSVEGCRRAGLLVIEQNAETGEFRIKLTPTGSAKAFLLRINLK